MIDMILNARLRVLRRNLETVKNIGERVEDARGGLRTVVGFYEDPMQDVLLQEILTDAQKLRDQGLEGYVSDRIKLMIQNLERLQKLMSSEDLAKTVVAISKRSARLRDEALKEPMETYLRRSADTLINKIDALEEAFNEGARDDIEPSSAEHNAWRKYLELLPAVEDLFAEYVDFLGGLALRDSGYDEGICQLADELLHAIIGEGSGEAWKSFTVPSSHEMLDATLARIIRVGFPEWSIWALPLTAYGFFAVLVTDGRKYKEFGRRLTTTTDPHVAILLSDALATYVMGPAYAGALLLFRLDPRGSAGGGADGYSLNELRAKTVLDMLERLDEETDSDTCGMFRLALLKEWTMAVSRTALEPAPTEEEELLRAGVEVALASTPGIGDHASGISDEQLSKIVDFAARSMKGKEFGSDAWDKIARWAQDLAEGNDLDPDRIDTRADPLRQLVNAAWIARMTTTNVDPSDLTQEIDRHWLALEGQRESHAQPSVGGRPGNRFSAFGGQSK